MPTAQSPENQRWWSDWHMAHGQGSTLEVAFTGYLYTQGIAALEATPEALSAAWSQFQGWWNATA